MYEQCFQLNSRPFTSMPFVKHYFPASAIQQTLSSARRSIDRGSGPVVVIGESGCGKSLLLTMLEDQYRSRFSVANLACARLDDRHELLQNILFELKLPYRDMTEGELRLNLMDFLSPSDACPNGVLLLVDEAHMLPIELLDEIKLITNYVKDGQPRVRLVMAGNQRLEENLNSPRLESLSQRLAARCYLTRLSQSETAEYVTAHIDRSGGNGEEMFPAQTLRAIHDVTDGCPRFINQVCDHAMILAATKGQNFISDSLIQDAWRDVQSLPPLNVESDTPAATLGDQENWTVIEFGSLEDENSPAKGADFDSERSHSPPVDDSPVGFHVGSEEEKVELGLAEQEFSDSDFENVTVGPDQENDSHADTCDLVNQSEEGSNSESEDGSSCESESHDSSKHSIEVEVVSSEESSTFEEQEVNSSTDDGAETFSIASAQNDESDAEQNSELESNQQLGTASDPFVNPFDEAFDQEEEVLSSYAPLVAAQNQSSLSVTSNELELIQPLDSNSTEEQVAVESLVNEDRLSDDESINESNREESSLETAEPENQLSESLTQFNSETEASDFEKSDENIQRKADEILRALSSSQACDREAEETGEPIESLTTSYEVTSSSPDQETSNFETDEESIVRSQRMLQEILEANNQPGQASSETKDPAAEAEHDHLDENFQTQSGQVSSSNDDKDMIVVTGSSQEIQSLDDSPANSDEDTEPQKSIPFPANAVSTGQAQRMDYQQLFDQLRNIPTE